MGMVVIEWNVKPSIFAQHRYLVIVQFIIVVVICELMPFLKQVVEFCF